MLKDGDIASAHRLARISEFEERLRLNGVVGDDTVSDWDIASGEVNRNHASASLVGDNSPFEDKTIGWWQARIHPEDSERVIAIFAAAIAGKDTTVSVEYRFRKADDNYAYILNRVSFMRDVDGLATRAIGSMTDLTALIFAQDALARAEATMIHAVRHSALGTMASMIAHELNQLLAAITNYIRAGRRIASTNSGIALPTNFDNILRAAEENALRAGGIVHSLRRLTQRGRAARSTESISSLIDAACAIALIDAEISGVHISVEILSLTPPVLVDPIQIQQVLINLVRNSVEAFDRGKDCLIRIGARPSDGSVEVSVSDNGPGIDPEVARDLFKARESPKLMGMGIGLSVCRTIVEAHGGKIWFVESENGAEFLFTLPISQR